MDPEAMYCLQMELVDHPYCNPHSMTVGYLGKVALRNLPVFTWGSSINDVTAIGGEGMSILRRHYISLLNKKRYNGLRRGSKIVQN